MWNADWLHTYSVLINEYFKICERKTQTIIVLFWHESLLLIFLWHAKKPLHNDFICHQKKSCTSSHIVHQSRYFQKQGSKIWKPAEELPTAGAVYMSTANVAAITLFKLQRISHTYHEIYCKLYSLYAHQTERSHTYKPLHSSHCRGIVFHMYSHTPIFYNLRMKKGKLIVILVEQKNLMTLSPDYYMEHPLFLSFSWNSFWIQIQMRTMPSVTSESWCISYQILTYHYHNAKASAWVPPKTNDNNNHGQQ